MLFFDDEDRTHRRHQPVGLTSDPLVEKMDSALRPLRAGLHAFTSPSAVQARLNRIPAEHCRWEVFLSPVQWRRRQQRARRHAVAGVGGGAWGSRAGGRKAHYQIWLGVERIRAAEVIRSGDVPLLAPAVFFPLVCLFTS